MLDFDIALELLQKYGFSSNEHPYLFYSEPDVGLCILVDDEHFGKLERRKIFKEIEPYEEFLKKLAWMRDNAKKYNVRMVLDNYEIKEPRIMFLRDNRPMLIGEMFNIEAYDERNEKKNQLDKMSRIMYEIGDLLLVYDEIKLRQLNEMKLENSLRNELRRMYYELQKEVNFYNSIDVELNLTLLAELITNSGINEVTEIAIKDRYNLYKVKPPEDKDIMALLDETWDLLRTLETNERYYETCVEVMKIRNEMSLVETKKKLMEELNDDEGAAKIDLMAAFRKINKEFEDNKTFIYEDYIKSKIDNVNKKYAVFNKLETNSLADFLRESLESNDYDELMSRFAKENVSSVNKKIVKLPLNTVIADLNAQYKGLRVDEQAILILSNSSYYRELIEMINYIPDYENKATNELISAMSKYKGLMRLRNLCFDQVKKLLDVPENLAIKQSVFAMINFTSFESFISSLVNEMKKIKLIDKRMVTKSDIYLSLKYFEHLDDYSLLLLSNDVASIKKDYDYKRNIIGSIVVKCGSPVAYSPYYLEFGDLEHKLKKNEVRQPFVVKVLPHFNVIVNAKGQMISKDDFYVTVADYVSNPTAMEDISIVSKMKYNGKYLFSKASFLDSASAARVRSILQVTSESAAVNVTQNTAEAVNQPIVQQLVGDSSVAMVNSNMVTQPQVSQPAVSANVAQQQTQVVQQNNNIGGQ